MNTRTLPDQSAEPAGANDAAPALRAAAVLADGATNLDTLLAEVVQRLKQAGRQVRGLLMTYPDGDTDCSGAMVMVDVHTGAEYLVSQPLGAGSTGCRADPQGFARASQVLRRAADEQPELVVVNRFGGLEAEGGGMRAELLDLMAREVPLLTAVSPRFSAAWQQFTGGATLLPADADAVERWVGQVLPEPTR